MKYQTPLTANQNKELKNKLTDVVSNNISRVRKTKNFTQQELADKAGLHLTYVGHLEQGKYHPSTFVLWKIASVLQTSLDDLLR